MSRFYFEFRDFSESDEGRIRRTFMKNKLTPEAAKAHAVAVLQAHYADECDVEGELYDGSRSNCDPLGKVVWDPTGSVAVWQDHAPLSDD